MTCSGLTSLLHKQAKNTHSAKNYLANRGDKWQKDCRKKKWLVLQNVLMQAITYESFFLHLI